MALQDLASIAEIFGMVMVIVTLVFLAIQVRQNTRAVRLGTFHDISEALRAQYALIGGDNATAKVYWGGLSNPVDMDEHTGVQFYALMHNQMRIYENAYYQQLKGALDENYWYGVERQMRNQASMPGFVIYWEDRRQWYSDSFRRYVDEVIIPNAVDIELGVARRQGPR